MRRSLYYFVCPLGQIWRWNVEKLLRFWKVFNHRKIVSIVTGPGLEKPETVMECFNDSSVEFFEAPNDPALGETKYFLEGLSKLRPASKDEVTFYGHTKGVSHQGDTLRHVLCWTDAMYVLNLSSPELVDSIMSRYLAMGCYRQKMPHGGSDWHYSGTFFWFRNHELFSRDWEQIQKVRHGVEGYLGKHFKEDETFELTPFISHWQLYRYPPGEEIYTKWLKELIQKEVAGGKKN